MVLTKADGGSEDCFVAEVVEASVLPSPIIANVVWLVYWATSKVVVCMPGDIRYCQLLVPEYSGHETSVSENTEERFI